MRFLMAGALATLTAAGLAAIRPAVLTDEERRAALAIRETRMRADVRFLSIGLLEGRGPGTCGDRLARTYLASRFEAIGLEPGAPGGSWLLRGRDPELSRETVVYSAALDNASGLAALLAIADAFAALPERPRRSILLAAVALEKQGLPGADDLARHPTMPAGRLAAVFDLDGTSLSGRTRGVPVAGLGESLVDDWVRAVAEAQGRTPVPEALPGEGTYYRFDLTPDGDFGGAVEDARLLFHVGAKVADAPLAPEWRPGDEFEAARRKALADLGR